jgi:hypothetical protein
MRVALYVPQQWSAMTTYERQLLMRKNELIRKPGDQQLSNKLINFIIVGLMGTLLVLGVGSLLTVAADVLGATQTSNPTVEDQAETF